MKFNSKSRVLRGGTIFDNFNYLGLALFAITILYPFWNIFRLSFADAADANSLGIKLWNKHWILNSYEFIFSQGKVIIAYYNTIFRTSIATLLTLLVTVMASYSLAKKKLPGRNIITIYYLVPMFFGGGLIPSFLLIKSLGLMNSLWALIIPTLVSSYNIIIVRNFIMAIGTEMEEAALIDGAGYIRILYSIMLPVLKPVIATVALWTAVSHWNSWFDALIYVRDDSKVVLQLLLRRIIEMSTMDFNKLSERLIEGTIKIHTSSVIAATTVVTIGPIILVYPFLQKYFVKGIMIGSLKG